MARIDISDANKELLETYKDLKPIVDEIVKKNTKELDRIVADIRKNLSKNLTHQELYNYTTELSVEAYYMSYSKDMAGLRQDCAEALLRSRQAEVFNETIGTQSARNNEAIINTLDSQVISMIHKAVANCLKTKLDEAHRLCKTLENVLISKNAENKFRAGAGEPATEVKADEDIYDNDGGENPF